MKEKEKHFNLHDAIVDLFFKVTHEAEPDQMDRAAALVTTLVTIFEACEEIKEGLDKFEKAEEEIEDIEELKELFKDSLVVVRASAQVASRLRSGEPLELQMSNGGSDALHNMRN